MGEFQAGRWLLGLVIYFAIFISALAITEYVATSYSLDYSITATGDETLLDGLNSFGQVEQCTQERNFYNIKSGAYEEIGYFFSYSNQCKYTAGALSENSCTQIDGCTWENTTIFFFFETGEQFCDGYANLTSVGVQNWTQVDLSGTIEDTQTGDNRFCSFFENQNTCQTFGCTWKVIDYDTDAVSTATLWEIVGSMFTFQASFTDNVWLDFILNLVLFYIPLVALIIAIYFMIPVIH